MGFITQLVTAKQYVKSFKLIFFFFFLQLVIVFLISIQSFKRHISSVHLHVSFKATDRYSLHFLTRVLDYLLSNSKDHKIMT